MRIMFFSGKKRKNFVCPYEFKLNLSKRDGYAANLCKEILSMFCNESVLTEIIGLFWFYYHALQEVKFDNQVTFLLLRTQS